MCPLYALSKRVTDYPPVILGLTFVLLIPLGTSVMGVDPLAHDLLIAYSTTATFDTQRYATVALYAANTAWTIIYDTGYQHQDVEDDIKLGTGSMAIHFKDSNRELCSVVAGVFVALLVTAGCIAGFGPAWYTGSGWPAALWRICWLEST